MVRPLSFVISIGVPIKVLLSVIAPEALPCIVIDVIPDPPVVPVVSK